MSRASWIAARLRDFARGQSGASSTVEFVIALPLVLTLMFSSIDFGVVMLRQVFLDRAVDIAVRDVRLGRITAAGFNGFRDTICARTFLISNCRSSISIEMRPIDVRDWDGLEATALCVNRAEEISPVLEFHPGTGQQELMLIKVCLIADPFLSITGMVFGMPRDASGGYALVARAAWANEPR